MYYTTSAGWVTMTNADLMVSTYLTNQPQAVGNSDGAPKEFALHQNFPNPFNPSTLIKYQLPFATHVTLKLFDMLGREVTTLVDETKPAGEYATRLDARSLSSGVYFYRMSAGSFTDSKKLVLLK
jgi:hypothetical protein